jgi:hypothetical protein
MISRALGGNRGGRGQGCNLLVLNDDPRLRWPVGGAEMVHTWLKGLAPAEKLFPLLAKREGSVMVKKDLERIGIAYENEDGIADFHAAGRHTHITELLRNGTSLAAAKELARHSDAKMTMKYTHIGLNDQAKAVANLPAPRMPAKNAVREQALHRRCISGGAESHSASSAGKTDNPEKSESPCEDRGLSIRCHSLSKVGKARPTGFEPATPGSTVRCANQLRHGPKIGCR